MAGGVVKAENFCNVLQTLPLEVTFCTDARSLITLVGRLWTVSRCVSRFWTLEPDASRGPSNFGDLLQALVMGRANSCAWLGGWAALSRNGTILLARQKELRRPILPQGMDRPCFIPE